MHKITEKRKVLSRGSGFTLVEVLNVAVISAFIMGVLFYALNSGQFSWEVNAARAQVQAEVRRSIDWITKDARQTVSWDLGDVDNSPSGTHIKFRQVLGWDINTKVLQLTSECLEYTYDANSHTITRRRSDSSDNTLQTWTLNNIVEPPFYTRDTSGNTVTLNTGDLLTSRKLIVRIKGQKQVRGGLIIESTLTEEVKIRNE